MKPMAAEQLAWLLAVVGERTNPAAPELLHSTVTTAHRLAWEDDPQGDLARALARDVPPMLRRLVDAETQLATLRHLIADVVAEIHEGDELHTDDVRRRLTAAGISIEDDIATALAIRYADAAAGVGL